MAFEKSIWVSYYHCSLIEYSMWYVVNKRTVLKNLLNYQYDASCCSRIYDAYFLFAFILYTFVDYSNKEINV